MRSLVLLPVLAVALPAHAEIDNSAIECGEDATYLPRGDHWPMNPGDVGALFRQQKDGDPQITDGSDLDAVASAFEKWTSVDCDQAAAGIQPPNLRIQDANDPPVSVADYPTRDRGDEWSCSDGGACDDSCTAGCNLTSTSSIAYFVVSDWATTTNADSLTVALTTNLYIEATGYSISADMEFNAENYQWRTDTEGCSADLATCYHVGSVALHEVGHFVGLNHVMCTDAVMYPRGAGAQTRLQLSEHEKVGVCTIYPPRDGTVAASDFGEQCDADSECPGSDYLCIKAAGYEDSQYGWCAKRCSGHSDCSAGFRCADNGAAVTFCKPGLHDSALIDPATGNSYDICAPCTNGAQCSSGVCISEGGGEGICTLSCVAGSLPDGQASGTGCPDGMSCVQTDRGWSVCWPKQEGECGNPDYAAELNQVCYQENDPGDVTDDWWRPCAPDLVCFGFKQRCGGQQAACVLYCDESNPCPTDSSLTCCYGVDAYGSCLGPTDELRVGGCFDIRRVGESCVTAEQSICEAGADCFHFGDPVLSKCYGTCSSEHVGRCDEADTCVEFTDGCNNRFGLCCDTEILDDESACMPSSEIVYYDLGVACRTDEDCDSGLCQKYGGQGACSRPCNIRTGVGCPGDIDVNGDGTLDGGFTCKLIDGRGLCWPVDGPAAPPGGGDDSVPPPQGCCSAVDMRPNDVLLTCSLWLPLWVSRCRRRRRRR